MTKTRIRMITAKQCLMARAALRWNIDSLAEAAKVGRSTIHRFETGGDIKPSTITKLRATLEGQGVRFIEEGEYAGGVAHNISR